MTSKVSVRVSEIQCKVDRRSGKEAEKGPGGHLKAGEAGFVRIVVRHAAP